MSVDALGESDDPYEEDDEGQLSSLLGGGNNEVDEEEDLEDFDVLAGQAIRPDDQHADGEQPPAPQIRIRRRDEFDEDEPVATQGSDDEETPFFDDDHDDSEGILGDQGPLLCISLLLLHALQLLLDC